MALDARVGALEELLQAPVIALLLLDHILDRLGVPIELLAYMHPLLAHPEQTPADGCKTPKRCGQQHHENGEALLRCHCGSTPSTFSSTITKVPTISRKPTSFSGIGPSLL